MHCTGFLLFSQNRHLSTGWCFDPLHVAADFDGNGKTDLLCKSSSFLVLALTP